jgi:M-phase inducer tyrosine phosphatase
MDRLYPYPTDYQCPAKKQKRNHPQHRSALAVMPSLFANTNPSTQVLQVPQFSSNMQPVTRVNDDVNEFLSSDLELSFASTTSLNSPTRDSFTIPQSPVPMDISPAPTRVYPSAPKPIAGRPRAFTSSARLFGRDLSNDHAPTLTHASLNDNNNSGTTSNGKKLQRAALPFEWMAPGPVFAQVRSDH